MLLIIGIVLRELQKLFGLLYGSDQLNVESDSFLNELIHIGNSISHQSQLDPIGVLSLLLIMIIYN